MKCHNLNTWCVLDKSGTDVAKCHRKVASRRNAAGAIRSLVNARGLQHDCVKVLKEALAVRQRYREKRKGLGLELCKWRTSEICWVLGYYDKVQNKQIKKEVDERIDERVL